MVVEVVDGGVSGGRCGRVEDGRGKVVSVVLMGGGVGGIDGR